jgi:hypothetical protein
VLLALAGCAGGESEPAPRAAGASLGAPIRNADCADWRQATPQERRRSIDDIAAFAGGPVNSGSGRTIDSDKAYRLFERTCSQQFARGFKLYKLYTRAAAFDLRPR